MHAVDITNPYQYTPVIDDVKFFLEGIESLKELKEEEYDDEIIGSDNEHKFKMYTVKRDDDDKSQGGVISLAVCDKTMLHPTMETLVDKDMWIPDTGATSHITYSRIGGVNHHNTMVKQGDLLENQLIQILKWTFWSRTCVMMARKLKLNQKIFKSMRSSTVTSV
jgi:hypothetical protein